MFAKKVPQLSLIDGLERVLVQKLDSASQQAKNWQLSEFQDLLDKLHNQKLTELFGNLNS